LSTRACCGGDYEPCGYRIQQSNVSIGSLSAQLNLRPYMNFLKPLVVWASLMMMNSVTWVPFNYKVYDFCIHLLGGAEKSSRNTHFDQKYLNAAVNVSFIDFFPNKVR
jgi:hypothetical protein